MANDGTTGRRTATFLTRRRARADARLRRPPGRVLGGRGTPPDAVATSRAGAARDRHDVRSSTSWSPQHDQLQLIASLVEAGVTLDVAFDTLATMGGARGTRAAASHIRDALLGGRPLSEALHETGAPEHVRALVEGGERVGHIAPALRAAAELVRRLTTLKDALRSALVYPVVVLSLGLAILVIVALVVVPPLERTFTDLGGELPAATRAVLALSRPLRSPLLPLAVVGMMGLRELRRRHGRRRRGVSSATVMPLLRGLDHDVRLSVLARLMATMLGGGLPLVDVLRSVAEAIPHRRVHARVRAAVDAVESGGTALSEEALGGLLDAAERELLAVAERTGLLAAQWERVAERRDAALTARIGRIGTIAEPLLVVLVGALVGGAVLALYLPTFRVLELL